MFTLLTKNPSLLLFIFWIFKIYVVWDTLTDTNSFIPGPILISGIYLIFGVFELLLGIHFEYFKQKTRFGLFCGIVFSPLIIYMLGSLVLNV